MIHVEHLVKRYGRQTAVDDISFTCRPGTITGFLGPNGAGKSTTLRMMTGLTPPSAGRVTIDGIPYASHPNPGRVIGVMLDASAQHPGRSGIETLRLTARLLGLPGARAAEMLERVGLGGAGKRRVGDYSLGMRQRLGIARCLLADPALLILDEPMNGLDPAGILELRQLIRSFVDEGRTVFLSSHLLDEVEKTADEVAIVDRGRVVVQGPIREVVSGGEPTVTLEVDDRVAARFALSGDRRVRSVTDDGAGLRVVLSDGLRAAELNRLLVGAGVGVSRLEPATHSLEERFLDVTSRLEVAS
jgi:ABC-2 type transport system ATP-binding protein